MAAPYKGIEKIVSGGQTGVDRAALDAALAAGLPCGGWCPKGRKAEDGAIPEKYPLKETKSDDYDERTELNVEDSDATLVLNWGAAFGGTRFAIAVARKLSKPCLAVDLETGEGIKAIGDWLQGAKPRVLNVAGPRASAFPKAYAKALRVVSALIRSNGAPREKTGRR